MSAVHSTGRGPAQRDERAERAAAGAPLASPVVAEPSSGASLVIAAAVLWGTTGTAQALGPVGTDPLAVGAVRLAVGGGALLAAGLLGGGWRTIRAATAARRLPVGALLATVAGIAAYQPLFFAGVRQAGVALGTVVSIGSAPVVAGLLARTVDG